MLFKYFGTSSDDSGSGGPLSIYYYLALFSPEVLETFGNAFLTPFVLIATGVTIAPKFKFATGIVLAFVMGVAYGWAATVIAEEISDGLYTSERWLQLAITILLCVSGVITGLFQARKAERISAIEAKVGPSF